MPKTNEKKEIVLSAVAVITLIAVVVGATFAYFQAQGGGSSDIDARDVYKRQAYKTENKDVVNTELKKIRNNRLGGENYA